MIATVLFYLLPADSQHHRALQFLPQIVAYAAFFVWVGTNSDVIARLGLKPVQLTQGFQWGAATGLLLGVLNTFVILWIIPRFGYDILFLRETPHAQLPPLLMLPWGIMGIAVFVELNFRGFLLGRVLALAEQLRAPVPLFLRGGLAVGITALTFSFDPFMVVTFKYLHWIALWDGIVWGLLWLRLRNLYVPIIAHAVEVMMMYSVLRKVLIS